MFLTSVTDNHLLERARRLFGGAGCRVQVAALPWRESKDGIEVLLITSRDTGRWVLPKGWVEKNEELWDAAAREAEEEAGLHGSVSQFEAGRYFYSKAMRSGEDIACEVVVYPLKVETIADKWKEKSQRTRKWLGCKDASELVNEDGLARLILRFEVKPQK